MNFLFLKYNNYFNRKIRIEQYETDSEALDEYVASADEYFDGEDYRTCYHTDTNINFIPGDGITTTMVYNWYTDAWKPDYLICYEGEWNDAYINSRWFITKSVRTRKGQNILYLKRDTVSDNYAAFRNATAYIDKGYVDPANKLFLNKDNISANQIKVDEHLIGDRETNIYCPWIVGYVANKWEDSEGETPENNVAIKVPGSTFNYNGWDSFPLKDFIRSTGSVRLACLQDVTFNFRLATGFISSDGWEGYHKDVAYDVYNNTTKSYSDFIKDSKSSGNVGTVYSVSSHYVYDFLFFGHYEAKKNDIPVFHQERVNKYQLRQACLDAGFSGLDGITTYKPGSCVVKDNGVFYRVSVTEITQKKKTNLSGDMAEVIKNACTCPVEFWSMADNKSWSEVPRFYEINVTVMEDDVTANTTYHANIASGNTLNDAPYRMFCIPIPGLDQTISLQGYEDGQNYTSTITHNRDTILQIAGGLVTGLGKNLYDIQILPYCPIRGGDIRQVANTEVLDSSGDLPIIGDSAIIASGAVRCSWVKDTGGNHILPIYWSARSTFKFNSLYTLEVPYDDPLKAKRLVNTCFARLVSPNQANSFEFGIVQNGGIQGFNIDCQYKPFSPHIHVTPVFNGIYGKNWDKHYDSPYWIDKSDDRGLICAGDFSFPQTSSEWVNYQLDNKNYQMEFNRQIDSLELKQGWDEKSAMINGITGVIGGTAKGAASGAMVGGGYGAAVGAGLGFTTGVIDAVYNYQEVKELGRDQIQLQKDIYVMNNQNVQARPNNLTNIGALSPDFTFFPYCEIYQESLDEKEPIENKLKYEGFNIGVVGKVSDYIGPSTVTNFIRGALTRIENVSANEAQDIATELSRGLYIE